MKKTSVAELKERLVEISHLFSVVYLLDWDQSVNLPPKAADSRAAAAAALNSMVHGKLLEIDQDGLLSGLKKELDAGKIKGKDAVVVAETWRTFDRSRKLPDAFVREVAETTSKAQVVWAEARRHNDFNRFLPWLERIVKLKRQEAEYVGYAKSPYDALLDQYEPGMTSEEASVILNDLKGFLVPFLKKIKASKTKIDTGRIRGKFPLDKQVAFNEELAKSLGFDLEAGRLDRAVHPFASGLHPHDVRITTRYSEKDVLYSIGSTIHEAGHGLYEQGLPAEHFGTPLAESVSLGIHESQSRMWENMIGKSKAFWKHFYPKLRKEFPEPFRGIPLKEFYRIINKVSPSLIRTEADEPTYNLHIVLRFEIEKEMIEGSLDLEDLPEIWSAKMREYLGVRVPDDASGVLQDVHWSAGLIGYFPTYSFGNLYAAQFYAAMEKDIPDVERRIAEGEFKEIREWLRKHIHARGKTYAASGLVQKVTGEPLNSRYFAEYLERKYGGIYGA